MSKIEKIYRQFDNKIEKFGFNTTEEKQLFIILFVALIFSACCHIWQIAFFMYLHSMALVAVNSFSVVVCFICGAFLIKKNTIATGLIFSFEIALGTLMFSYIIGVDTFITYNYVVILMVQMIIPYAKWKIRIPMMVIIFGFLFASFFIGEVYLPVLDITPIHTMYSIFNIALGVGGIISIVAVNNAISKIVSQFNKTQLNKYMNEAHVDALTGLYNRRYAEIVFDNMKKNMEKEDSWCVAILDIDDFKGVNDTYGHDAGDIVLCVLARIVKTSLRKTDYVFRWGGEEFLMLLNNINIVDSYHILNKMRSRIQENIIDVGGRTICITVTIGLCKCDINNIDQSIKISDDNLYKGKCAGKNVVIV